MPLFKIGRMYPFKVSFPVSTGIEFSRNSTGNTFQASPSVRFVIWTRFIIIKKIAQELLMATFYMFPKGTPFYKGRVRVTGQIRRF